MLPRTRVCASTSSQRLLFHLHLVSGRNGSMWGYSRHEAIIIYVGMCVCNNRDIISSCELVYVRNLAVYPSKEAGGQHFLEPKTGLFSKNSLRTFILIVEFPGKRKSVWNSTWIYGYYYYCDCCFVLFLFWNELIKIISYTYATFLF